MLKEWLNRLRRTARRERKTNQRGFTLVEMLVVITIIALIMSVAGPRVLTFLTESKVKAARIQIESFSSALDLYFIDMGRYPSKSEGLVALLQRPTNVAAWGGPYLKGNSVPSDPWGKPYVYQAPGHGGPYELISYGADGQEGGSGTAADIIGPAR